MSDRSAGSVPGLKVGLEIHQQLSTGKLFCRCPSTLSETVVARFQRRLRPVQSELGEVDKASLAEARKAHTFQYESTPSNCLVEADEEPPADPEPAAIDVALAMSRLLQAHPVDELTFMRKVVIDGSNTSGFQRTGLVALDGSIVTDSGIVGIESICLEEDSARRVEQDQAAVTYRLDRLGIPLIEIATAPQIHTPQHAQEVAARLGALLRATGRVRRGLGTIRQDLNVSIPEGRRVELKGVQDLRSIPEVIRTEAARQRSLVDLATELRARGADPASITSREPLDLTPELATSSAKVIRSGVASGQQVLAVVLPWFEGLLRSETSRFGKELAGQAKVLGLRGLFHGDELPAYGIELAEVQTIRNRLGVTPGASFLMVVARGELGRIVLHQVLQRCAQALEGVPSEVRRVEPDGSSAFLRPMPGAARMYPETDVQPVLLDSMRIAAAPAVELPEQRRTRFAREYALGESQASQIFDTSQEQAFEEAMAALETLPGNHAPREVGPVVARLLLQELPLAMEGKADTAALEPAVVAELVIAQLLGRIPRDSVAPILAAVLFEGGMISDLINQTQAEGLSLEAARGIVRAVVEERREFVLQKGDAAVGPLMGPVMGRLRGKLSGGAVNRLVEEEIRRLLSTAGS